MKVVKKLTSLNVRQQEMGAILSERLINQKVCVNSKINTHCRETTPA
jgi:hypothetical protein